MAAALELWKTFADNTSDAILDWARPDGYVNPGPMSGNFLASGYAAFTIAFGYLVFVFIASYIQKNVRDNKPVGGLYGFKFAYNIVQVMLCSWMCIEAGVQAYKHEYKILIPCEKFNQTEPAMGFVLYVFYLSKILDFMDTIFIIAECRWAQLSFLHVYHHFSIFLFYWLNLNVGYDGDVFLTIVLNGAIHTVMYTYYFVSLHMNKGQGIWWKAGLTMSQMIQFVLMNLQAGYLIWTGCDTFPINIVKAYFYYILTLLALFMHFFIQDNFFKKKNKKTAVTDSEEATEEPSRSSRSRSKGKKAN
jgi:elongation of very long chain fatty acids protein 4